MQSRKKILSWLVAALAITVLCALAASGDQGENDPIKQQAESFTFINETGMAVDGLVITFDVNEVKTTGSVTFSKATTVKRDITFSKGVVSSGNSTGVAFERDGAFRILSWQWTANGAGTGIHQGAPVCNPCTFVSGSNPGPPGSSPPPAPSDVQTVRLYRGFPMLGSGE